LQYCLIAELAPLLDEDEDLVAKVFEEMVHRVVH